MADSSIEVLCRGGWANTQASAAPRESYTEPGTGSRHSSGLLGMKYVDRLSL
jgi:hypothetical protein